jgi:DNA repair protein RAD7
VMEYMIERNTKIKHIELDTTNLISDENWRKLFQARGAMLETLKLSNLDDSLDDESIAVLAKHCTNLRRLELTEVWKNGEGTLDAIATIESLEHLVLDLIKDTKPENLVNLIEKRGPTLQTIRLYGFKDSDDTFLEMVHSKCKVLQELCFNDNAVCTDKGFTELFTDWENPPLTSIDFSSNRCMDNTDPDGPEEPIGLASEGFKAMMKHSGSKLVNLDIHSCRHISHEAFSEVFSEGAIYPKLQELDISFHPVMDDYLVGRIFKCCPALTKVVAFGCFGVRDVRIPPGVALIGALTAQDPIVVEGDFINAVSAALFPSG